MAHLLHNLNIEEISLCKKGANQDAKVTFFKSMEPDMPDTDTMKQENDQLKGQVAALQKTIDDLKAASVEKKETVESKIEKLDPEIQATIAKIQEDAKTASAELAKAKDAIAKMEAASLEKSIKERLEKCPRATAGQKVEDMVAKLAKLDNDAREMVFTSFEKSEAVAGQAESLFKETGHSGASVEGTAKKEIMAKVEELRKSNDEFAKLSDAAARVEIRKMFPELAQRERDEA